MTPEQRGLFFRSLVLLPVSAALLRRQGLGWVQQRVLSHQPVQDAAVGEGREIELSRDAAEAVDLAARKGVWRANCLQRSVVLWRELVRYGVKGDLRIGVRGGGPDQEMHAWIEVADHVINDRPDIGSEFRPFERPILPPGARFD
jgi:hypothetical protein